MKTEQLRLYRRFALRRALQNRAIGRNKPATKDEQETAREHCREWREIARKWRQTPAGPEPVKPSVPYMTVEYWQNYKPCTPATWFRKYKNLAGWLAFQQSGRAPKLPKAECLKRVRVYMAKYNVTVAELVGNVPSANGNGHAAKPAAATRWQRINGQYYRVPV